MASGHLFQCGACQAFPDVRIVIHDLIQVPGRIAVRAEISGTHQGELFGIAPTGKQVSFRLHGQSLIAETV
ncbi:ester cyclase [Paraburkholderia unamae]|uniref:Ester cyclase n=1 Tax=Paraburkholderia unamae TaxID=219649 RepID=A0ACC6RQW2_9BURK